jgi:hypothetical protein
MNFFRSAATKFLLGVGTPINEASFFLVSSVSFVFAALAFWFSAASAFFVQERVECRHDSGSLVEFGKPRLPVGHPT